MLVDAILFVQDIQLLCYSVVFGALALRRWRDGTRRWLWFSFLVNAVGAAVDLLSVAGYVPRWIGHGLNLTCYPLSYAFSNIALVYYERFRRPAAWVSLVLAFAAVPFFVAWSGNPAQFANNALVDGMIGVECAITLGILALSGEEATRAPRWLLAGFLVPFCAVEFARLWVALVLHTDPDAWWNHKLEFTSGILFVLDMSIVPLAFIWWMNARLEAELMRLSMIDPLTSVLNRRGLMDALEREMARYLRYGHDFTVSILDIDHFKALNDRYGHPAGDDVLAGIAGLLSGRLRRTDMVGRLGGEEFVILLPHTDEQGAEGILAELGRAIREYSLAMEGETVHVTASFGVTGSGGRRALSAVELLREADIGLYQAKHEGRDRICCYSAAEAAIFPTTLPTG